MIVSGVGLINPGALPSGLADRLKQPVRPFGIRSLSQEKM